MTTLLRELLDERSTTAPDATAHHARLAHVHRRITRVRRHRVASAAATVLAVVVAVTAVMADGRATRTAPPADDARPSASVSIIGDIPEYYAGGHVLKAASATLPDGAAELTFVPDSLDLVIVTKCSEPGMSVAVTTQAGERELLCGGRLWLSGGGLPVMGITVGEPATVTLTAVGTRRFIQVGEKKWREEVDPVPDSGTISVGVARPMQFKDFPLPPRPAVLPPLMGGSGEITTVRSAPGDPLAPQTVEVWGHDLLNFFAQLQTPGILRVEFNGKVFMTCTKWDYEPTGARQTQLDADNGCTEERVNDGGAKVYGGVITVTPEGVTGDWQVRVDG